MNGRLKTLLPTITLLLIFSLDTLAKNPIVVTNLSYRLVINADKGTIESFRSTISGGDNSLLATSQPQLPILKIGLLAGGTNFRTISSLEAKKITAFKSNKGNEEIIEISFDSIARLNLDAKVFITCPQDKPFTYWNLELSNRTGMWISHIQLPVLKVPYDANPTEESGGKILYSMADGMLAGPLTPTMQIGAWLGSKYDTPETWRTPNYPREYTTQMMAYYNPSAGLYIACDDPTGLPKLIAPLKATDGITMGVGHYPAIKNDVKYKLPYNIIIGTFRGDWYEAADIYRSWAEKQPFCATKLKDREKLPDWLLKPLVGVAFPMRGQADWDYPAAVNSEYTPATNALPYLEKLATGFNAPLMPIVFNWENKGPWVQPEAFPPLGGEAAMKSFMKQSKAKGWHPVLYGDALNWVIEQKNTGYDGLAYFKKNGGDEAACRNWDGSLYLYPGCRGTRMFHTMCIATKTARDMVLEMTRKITQLGPDVVQQFDQIAGPVACFDTTHGHSPVPGPWMTKDFKTLLREHVQVARKVNPEVVIAVEASPPEIYLQDFELWDARTGGSGEMMCPLFQYLYHEYMVGHSGFLVNSVNDEALRASVARAFVSGYFLNFTLRDKGQIHYEWDDLWDRAVPDQTAIIDWARRATAFRENIARDFLVFGKMQKPLKVTNVPKRDFGHGKEFLVHSTTWKAPDGRTAVALANYSDVAQKPRIELEGTGNKKIKVQVDDKVVNYSLALPAVLELDMPSRSVGLVEIEKP